MNVPGMRTYPLGFGLSLQDAMDSWKPQPVMRQKVDLDPRQTDLEIFQGLDLGDVWSDARLVETYWYLRNSKKASIPDSWEETFQCFDAALKEVAPSSTSNSPRQ